MQVEVAAPSSARAVYAQRSTNTLQRVFRDHFNRFAGEYDQRYAKELGNSRIERISQVASRFIACGDYRQGVARIRCSNPDCHFEYFRPFSCRGFHLCPSCSQKRALLFAEYLDEQLLLALPHRQFVFTLPKALRVFLRYDQRLFGQISRLIFSLVTEFYSTASGRPITGAAVVAFQPFGDALRWNPHYHALILEGGFDPEGRFIRVPIHDTARLTQLLRQRTIGLFLELGLITEQFAETLLRWKHSGFSVDYSVLLEGGDHRARQALAQYAARAPLSLQKLTYDDAGAKVLYHTAYNPYLKQNTTLWDAVDFIAALTQFIPPWGVRYVHYFGLYASRCKARWDQWPHVAAVAPNGWKESHGEQASAEAVPNQTQTVPQRACRSAWAKLIIKVYEVDPLVCCRCGSAMTVIAVITDPPEVRKILRHLVKIGRAPPGLDPSLLN
ncbi:MAG: transposase [Armatimonadetes bacterium]|nr:transposase [Armatimonadota bacterium]